ncbi:MAG: hypothetical protein CL676_11330 [Bdellovibrionaceae bacterium]|nr:hypothetical protein [Pseudobdellovibrionaceae bacterium]|tara:strand:- start:387 stop:806 length:420 start_codon:yes stop_codon:yes gene_type:complete
MANRLFESNQKRNFKLTIQGAFMSKQEQLELQIGGSTCVRMSSQEYSRIRKESNKTGKSIPELLREAYFSTPPRKVLVNKDDLTVLRKDINKIGNNLNQVARKLNAGFMHGWSNTLDLVLEQFQTLTNQIHYGYGVHKG